MRAVRSQDVDAASFSNHRGGDQDFRRLLAGEQGTPNNYAWSIVRFGPDYTTPRHRHNFSQIHFMLEGDHEWAPDRPMTEGSVTYQPEGVYYGPQQGSGSLILGLQFGEASGNGFMSYDQLAEGSRELERIGAFEGGVFKAMTDDGRRIQKDGYEAIWEHVNGREIEYPKARYLTSITMLPDAFGWVTDPDQPGIARKHLGTFSERGTRVEFLRFDDGASHHVTNLPSIQLYFILSGELRCNGESYGKWTAFEFDADDDIKLEAAGPTETYVIQLPAFDG